MKKIVILLVALCCSIANTGQLAAEVKEQVDRSLSEFSKADLLSEAEAQNEPNGLFQKNYIDKIKFQGYGYVGMAFTKISLGTSVDISSGVRFYDYLYLGAEFEYRPIFFVKAPSVLSHEMFFGADLKGYIPVSENFYPFLNFQIGGVCDATYIKEYVRPNGIIMPSEWVAAFGFDFRIGIGVDYKRFSFGIGYEGATFDFTYGVGSLGYVKFGVRF